MIDKIVHNKEIILYYISIDLNFLAVIISAGFDRC